MLKNLTRLDIIRKICYLYFFVYIIIALVDNNFGPIGYGITIALGLFVIAQMISKGNKADLIIGVLSTMVCFYLCLAVTSDLIDHYNGTKTFHNMSKFRMYFGFGYGIFGTATAASLIIIYAYYSRVRKLENKRKALQE